MEEIRLSHRLRSPDWLVNWLPTNTGYFLPQLVSYLIYSKPGDSLVDVAVYTKLDEAYKTEKDPIKKYATDVFWKRGSFSSNSYSFS